jgi:hypothetical protein
MRYRNRKCALLEGSCLAAPRWVSLLVSEMFYPEVDHGVPVPHDQAQHDDQEIDASQSHLTYQQPQEDQYLYHQAQQQQQTQTPYAPYRSQYGRDFQSAWPAADEHDSSNHHQQEPQPVYASQEAVSSQVRRKRDAGGSSGAEGYCDGYDEKGCYQVRMYYDWFLVSGSCKCWRQSFSDYLGSKR